MSFLFIYLLKLSVTLAVVFIFYHFVLRKLTFYNWNRWYLLGYSFLSFFIALINITPVLERNDWSQIRIVQWVPVIDTVDRTITATPVQDSMSSSQWIILLILGGMIAMFIRLLIQFLSFKKMIRKATPIAVEKLAGSSMRLFQVDEDIVPFSFGNSIFINQHLHSRDELQEIVWHEFIHVKQKHSFDIMGGEILCLLNWYNPFAWLLRHAIRQNLEFIADNKVLENGVDRKEYQYLLLKVIGNKHFSIAPKFNFSSLKKRIAMMNKLKSTKRQLLRMLFLLPATTVLLVAFRNKISERTGKPADDKKVNLAGLIVDAKTMTPLPGATIYCKEKNITVTSDAQGFYKMQLPYEDNPLQFSLEVSKDGYGDFHQTENWGNFYNEGIKKAFGNTYEFFGLGNKENGGYGFSAIMGNTSSPEELNAPQALKQLESFYKKVIRSGEIMYRDTVPPTNVKIPDAIKSISVNNKGNANTANKIVGGDVIVTRKDGKQETYKLDSDESLAAFQKKYGVKLEDILPPPPPPPPVPVDATPAIAPVPPVPPTPPVKSNDEATPVAAGTSDENINLSRMSSEFEITDKKAWIKLKDGHVENYDLTNAKDKAAFESKYGKIYNLNLNTSVNSNVNTDIRTTVRPAITTSVNPKVNTSVKTDIKTSVNVAPVAVATSEPVTVTGYPVAEARGGVTSVRTVPGRATALSPRPVTVVTGGRIPGDYTYAITGKEDIIITITKNTTREELEKFKAQMKEKGVTLNFDDIDYNEKGKLVNIKGTMKMEDNRSQFVANGDFEKLILAMIKDGDRIFFKVSVKEKEVI